MTNRKLVGRLLWVIAFMITIVIASVPLYNMFCSITGIGGVTTKRLNYQSDNLASAKEVTVQFDSNVVKDLPWKFHPLQKEIKVKVGQTALVYFYVENTSDEDIIGTSIYNVTPQKVGQYFVKIQCFCFEEQLLRAHEGMKMPVLFAIDKDIATNPDTEEVDLITLSYTFFRFEK